MVITLYPAVELLK